MMNSIGIKQTRGFARQTLNLDTLMIVDNYEQLWFMPLGYLVILAALD